MSMKIKESRMLPDADKWEDNWDRTEEFEKEVRPLLDKINDACARHHIPNVMSFFVKCTDTTEDGKEGRSTQAITSIMQNPQAEFINNVLIGVVALLDGDFVAVPKGAVERIADMMKIIAQLGGALNNAEEGDNAEEGEEKAEDEVVVKVKKLLN